MDVKAKDPNNCNQPVGQMHLVIEGSPRPFDTVSFYCNKQKLHLDQCAFVGVELVVTRRRREDGKFPRTL